MKKLTKLAFISAGAVAVGYSMCCLTSELLFNRKMKPSDELSRKIAGTNADHLQSFLEDNLKWLEDYGYETHCITSDRGENLVGYLLRPEKPSDKYIFCAHGYRSYGKKEFCGVAQHYIKKGYNVFFPDHVASGESEGKYCTFGYYEKNDCIKWLQYMLDCFGEDIVIYLHGVSMGSATVCMMSEMDELPENVKAIVADCGFSSATELYSYKAQEVANIKGKNTLKLVSKINKKRLGFYFEEIEPVKSVKNAKVPILFIHGALDALVPCHMAYELYDACGNEGKELLIIEDADHAQSYFKNRGKFTSALDRFLEKHK